MTFSWTYGRRNNLTKQSTSIGDTSILTLKKVRRNEAGRYRCTVKSGSLSVTSSAAFLTVIGAYCTLCAIANMLHCINFVIVFLILPTIPIHCATYCCLLPFFRCLGLYTV